MGARFRNYEVVSRFSIRVISSIIHVPNMMTLLFNCFLHDGQTGSCWSFFLSDEEASASAESVDCEGVWLAWNVNSTGIRFLRLPIF